MDVDVGAGHGSAAMSDPNHYDIARIKQPMTEDATTRQLCCAPAPNDRYGRRCEKPLGHDGTHWTCVGEDETLTWQAEDATTPPTPEWQPFDTAPKDGSWLWMRARETSKSISVSAFKWDESHQQWFAGTGWWYDIGHLFTHWKPILKQADYDALAVSLEREKQINTENTEALDILMADHADKIEALAAERDHLTAQIAPLESEVLSLRSACGFEQQKVAQLQAEKENIYTLAQNLQKQLLELQADKAAQAEAISRLQANYAAQRMK